MIDQFKPRPAQKDILAYKKGTLGVSAVPGSGKTWTLSYLAAKLIDEGALGEDQEVLIVTLVNSAVSNFSQRISQFLTGFGRIPSLGYRVRTLHGLAHDIVKERPELAGLDTSFQIIDEREAIRIREDAVYNWLRKYPNHLDSYFISDINEKKKENLYQKQIPAYLSQLSLQFIRTAKNLQLSPEAIRNQLKFTNQSYPLVDLGLEIYEVYQRNLEYSGTVDFDDLINKAHQVLNLDSTLLERLQDKWPFILEDEAQDSSLIQQKILSKLAKRSGQFNWVRVGDPNQAIYESFTTADPKLLNEFIKSADKSYVLPNSGRNTKNIIDLANHLVAWTINNHPSQQVRDALFPNDIQPTPPGDSQPNPISHPDQINLYAQALTADKEIQLIASSASNWLDENPDKTAAILVPRNERGKKIAGILRSKFNVEPVELLNSSLETRKTTGALVIILDYLIDPSSSKKLSAAYKVWNRAHQLNQDSWKSIEADADLISGFKTPELFLSHEPLTDWGKYFPNIGSATQLRFNVFKKILIKWQEAALLPIDQIILTISGAIFETPAELTLSHKLANFQKQLSNQHPDWTMPVLLDELKTLARNERRFFAGGEESHFNPEEHQGKVVITTAHKAKGLEWDRVYLISVNNYNFPSGENNDTYIAEKWYLRDQLNLPAEALSQLSSLMSNSDSLYSEGESSALARDEYIRERLRLLYVSITRAKQELIITWNTGRGGKYTPAVAFTALTDYYAQEQISPTEEVI